MSTATFVLSTGRCGTQWLAGKMKAEFGETMRVEHEPLHNHYEPRLMLGAKTPIALGPEPSQRILVHIEEIEQQLHRGDYLECGHPCWSSLPYLAERFAGRIRIVHLTRHPVPTALSWLTHAAFVPPFLPHLREKVLISPYDEGVAFPPYRERWPSMTPFEKCLYYWAEVNAFGLRLEETGAAPWLRLSYEDLFSGAGVSSLLEFLGLPERAALGDARAETVDEHRFVTGACLPDLRVIETHGPFVEIAERLGYDVAAVDPRILRSRYSQT
jgi:hypothetical protein